MNPKLLTSLGVIVLLLSGVLLVSVARAPKVSVEVQKSHVIPNVQTPSADLNGTVQTQVNVLNDTVSTHVVVKKK